MGTFFAPDGSDLITPCDHDPVYRSVDPWPNRTEVTCRNCHAKAVSDDTIPELPTVLINRTALWRTSGTSFGE